MLKPRISSHCLNLLRTTESTISARHIVSQHALRTPETAVNQRRNSHGFASELGLRRNLPPDSLAGDGGPSEPSPKNNGHRNEPEWVSDREWDIRTGRAIDILIHTLPDFFNVGLLTSIDKTTGEPQRSSSIPVVGANPLHHRATNENIELLYSPKVKLSYTPPVELPAPFTLKIEGLPLYIASSAFVRHTLNALYSDLRVVIHKVSVHSPKSGNEAGRSPQPMSDTPSLLSSRRDLTREKSIFLGLHVTGTARVSGSSGEWQVNCTYEFSSKTGLIHRHIIDSIEPAPHQTVYDALRASLGGIFGPVTSSESHRPNPAFQQVRVHRTEGKLDRPDEENA